MTDGMVMGTLTINLTLTPGDEDHHDNWEIYASTKLTADILIKASGVLGKYAELVVQEEAEND